METDDRDRIHPLVDTMKCMDGHVWSVLEVVRTMQCSMDGHVWSVLEVVRTIQCSMDGQVWSVLEVVRTVKCMDGHVWSVLEVAQAHARHLLGVYAIPV